MIGELVEAICIYISLLLYSAKSFAGSPVLAPGFYASQREFTFANENHLTSVCQKKPKPFYGFRFDMND